MKLIISNINSLDDNKINLVKDKFPKRYEFAIKQNSIANTKRLLLGAYLLISYLNIEEKDIKVNQYGKPYVNNNYFFNLSKSNELVVLAISENEVGVDVECVTNKDVSAIINNLLIEEKEYLENNKEYNFYKIWTAKESFMKLIGSGLSYSFRKFSTIGLIKNNEDIIDNKKVYFKSIDYDNYVISISSFTPINELEIIK